MHPTSALPKASVPGFHAVRGHSQGASMGVTNSQSGTRVDEIADGIYRISTPVPRSATSRGFTFNQFLVRDDEPLIFHTGPRRIFALTSEAVRSVIPPETLRWVAFSHWEPDESGAMNEWLALAPHATVMQGRMGVNVFVRDQAIRPGRALGDGEEFAVGKKRLTWIDTPHLPHGWDCGFLFESTTRTLLAGDLFTQGGDDVPPLVESDILAPSEAMRKTGDYYSHTKNPSRLMEKLACHAPTTLACMHGSSWRGDGAALLRQLARSLDESGS
jgi:flavorubredoxin